MKGILLVTSWGIFDEVCEGYDVIRWWGDWGPTDR